MSEATPIRTRIHTGPKQFRPCSTDRESSSARGYSETWAKYARGLRLERVYCELCLACGFETPLAGQTNTRSGTRARSQGVVDHIIPVNGPEDPLFWDDLNHWCLCNSCNDWKSRMFDGAFGMVRRLALRDVGCVTRRKHDIIQQKQTY